MKAPLSLLLLIGLLPTLLSAGTPPPPSGKEPPVVGADSPVRPLAQGLLVTEFPRHPLQNEDHAQFYVDPDQFGKPIAEPYVIKSISPWHWNGERNAMASGYLQIEAAGDYTFSSNSFYDRNILTIDGKIVCGFRDGENRAAVISLKPGFVKIVSVGLVESRGSTEGIHVRWKVPGQAELSDIRADVLWHPKDAEPKTLNVASTEPHANYLITVANDYIVEAYQNGAKIPIAKRKLLEERFGATAERIDVAVRPGDWLVFHVVYNRLRWGGSHYFAVAGELGPNNFGFVSDPASPDWSYCDDPTRFAAFIEQRDLGAGFHAKAIAKPWDEGDGYMRQFAGAGFPGKPVWGRAASTWIKYVAPAAPVKPVALKQAGPATPKASAVKILSAIYSADGKTADVTDAVKEHVETKRHPFSVTPPDLGADPKLYWQKALDIVYMKDGVRREQHHHEGDVVHPESFYGPQDAGELRTWLTHSRWTGENGEIQLNEDHSVSGAGLEETPHWEAIENNKLRIEWSRHHMEEYVLNPTWDSFHEADNAKATFHLVK